MHAANDNFYGQLCHNQIVSDCHFCERCRGRGANPIAHVLQALGEELELLEYDQWQVLLPEGTFMTKVGLIMHLPLLYEDGS